LTPTLIRPPSVNRQKSAQTILIRFFCLNRYSCFPVPTCISQQPVSGFTFQRKGPAPNTYRGSHRCCCYAGSGCAGNARATWKLYRTRMPSHSKHRAHCFRTAQLVPGSARGRTLLKQKQSIHLCKERDGAPIQKYKFPEYQHSDRIALVLAHCSIVGRRSCSLMSALVGTLGCSRPLQLYAAARNLSRLNGTPSFSM